MIAALEFAAIRQHAKLLKLPTLGGQFERFAEQAAKEAQTHTRYLEALLEAEVEERERQLRRTIQEIEAEMKSVASERDASVADAVRISAESASVSEKGKQELSACKHQSTVETEAMIRDTWRAAEDAAWEALCTVATNQRHDVARAAGVVAALIRDACAAAEVISAMTVRAEQAEAEAARAFRSLGLYHRRVVAATHGMSRDTGAAAAGPFPHCSACSSTVTNR
jgi:hypothetical protein